MAADLDVQITTTHTLAGSTDANNHVGPFKDGNGNLYVVLQDKTTQNAIDVFKSTDGGQNWAVVDSANRPDSNGGVDGIVRGLDVYQRNQTLYIATFTDNLVMSFHTFRTSDNATPDSWGTVDKVLHTFTNTVFNYNVTILVLANGDIFIAHTGEGELISTTTYERAAYSYSQDGGNTWTLNNVYSETGITVRLYDNQAALDASGRIILTIKKKANEEYLRRVISGGVTGTPDAQVSYSTGGSAEDHADARRHITYVSGANDRAVHAHLQADFTPYAYYVQNGGNPVTIGQVTTDTVYDDGQYGFQYAAMTLVAHGTDIYLVYLKPTDATYRELKWAKSADCAAFDAPVSQKTSTTCINLSANVYGSDMGVLTDDTAEVRYLRFSLSGVPLLANLDSIHGHIAENLALTQIHSLEIAEAFHGHTAENLVLTAPVSIAVRQTAQNVAPGTQITATLPQAALTGNLLLALHFTNATSSSGPTGWSEALALTDSSANLDEGAIYYKLAVGGETAVTCYSSDNNDNMLLVMEISGSWDISPLDQTAKSNGASFSKVLEVTTPATTVANEAAVTLFTYRLGNSGVDFVSWNSGWVEQAEVHSTAKTLAGAVRVLSSIGTVTATATAGSATTSYGMLGVATFKTAAAGVQLVIVSGLHSHTADNLLLTQAHLLAILETLHSHTADSPTLASGAILDIAEASHLHSAENLVLVFHYALLPSDSSHSHVADNLGLAQNHNLLVAEASHSHLADSLALVVHLAPADALHPHTADNLVLLQAHTLQISAGLHLHSADSLNLGQVPLLAVAEALHAHTAEAPTLAQAHTLVAQGATHSHAADNLGLTQAHTLGISAGAHAHGADNLSLTQQHILAAQESLHLHSAEVLALGVGLLVADSTHLHSADNIALVQQHNLVVQESVHTHSADNLTLGITGLLVVQGASHTHTVDSIALSQQHRLAVASGLHPHSAESLALGVGLLVQEGLHAHSADPLQLAQAHTLTVAEASHAHSAQNVALEVGLGTQETLHAHSADNLALLQHHLLSIAAGAHSHTAEVVGLGQTAYLQIAASQHPHTAEGVLLLQHHLLTVEAASHSHAASGLVLVQKHVLVIAAATHPHNVDTLGLGVGLLVAEATHPHTADNLTLVQAHRLLLADSHHNHIADNLVPTQQHILALADGLHAHSGQNVVLLVAVVLTLVGKLTLRERSTNFTVYPRQYSTALSDRSTRFTVGDRDG